MSEKKRVGRVSEFDYLIGNKIKEFREMFSLTQGDLGNILEVTFQQIQKYEHGINRIHSEMLWKLAFNFGISVSFFFPEEDDDKITKNNISSAILAAEDHRKFNSDYMTDKETIILIKNYSGIKDKLVRKKITNLIESIIEVDNKV